MRLDRCFGLAPLLHLSVRDERVDDEMIGATPCLYFQLERNGFQVALCIDSDPGANLDPGRFAISPAIQAARTRLWARFRWIDLSAEVMEIVGALETIFTPDADIHTVTCHDDDPY